MNLDVKHLLKSVLLFVIVCSVTGFYLNWPLTSALLRVI